MWRALFLQRQMGPRCVSTVVSSRPSDKGNVTSLRARDPQRKRIWLMSSSDKDSAVPQRRGFLKQIAAIAGGLRFAPGLAGGVAAGAALDLVTAPAAAQAPQAAADT